MQQIDDRELVLRHREEMFNFHLHNKEANVAEGTRHGIASRGGPSNRR
jgi:hypothetical protein